MIRQIIPFLFLPNIQFSLYFFEKLLDLKEEKIIKKTGKKLDFINKK